MKLKIITPEKLFLEKEVDSVTLSGETGQMTLLPGHAAMVASLKRGKFYTRTGATKSEEIELQGGFVEVLPANREILVLVSS